MNMKITTNKYCWNVLFLILQAGFKLEGVHGFLARPSVVQIHTHYVSTGMRALEHTGTHIQSASASTRIDTGTKTKKIENKKPKKKHKKSHSQSHSQSHHHAKGTTNVSHNISMSTSGVQHTPKNKNTNKDDTGAEMNTNNSNNTQKHKRRRRGRHNLKPGAHYDLTEEELFSKTTQLLEKCGDIGNMTAGQAHEAGRQLISWSKRHTHKSGEVSELLLRRLISERNAGNQYAKPSVKLFNSVMNAWTKCGRDCGHIKALELLKEMNVYVQKHQDAATKRLHIAKCYCTVIDGCCKAKSKTSKEADIAYELLEKMDLGRQTKHYNAVLNAYASIYDYNSVIRIFQDMKKLSELGNKTVEPNRTTYNIMIKSLSGSKKMHCVRKAEEVLFEMENAFLNGNKHIAPDKISYTSILSAWSRTCTKQAIEKAEMYLEKMNNMYSNGNNKVKPDSVTYNTVLSIIANSRSFDAGDRGLDILEKMEQLYELGDADVKPNLISYNAVIKAFSNNPFYDGAPRSLKMLEKLERHEFLKPDIITYNTCLNACAKSKDPISAQLLIDRMETMYAEGNGVRPDTYSYNTLISAWAFSGHHYGAEIAETIFDRMETSQIRLDTTTFNTLLSAWGRQNDPERATDILHHMFAVKKSGQYDVRPTRQSFGIVINAWAKTSYPRKAFKARALLKEMKERSEENKHLKPNAHIYASVLNACAYTFGTEEVKQEALSIAIETFKECTQRNDVVYGTFIKACNTLMEDGDTRKIDMIKASFLYCRQKGLVSDFVLQELHTSLPLIHYEEIMGSDAENSYSIKNVPKQWSCNTTM